MTEKEIKEALRHLETYVTNNGWGEKRGVIRARNALPVLRYLRDRVAAMEQAQVVPRRICLVCDGTGIHVHKTSRMKVHCEHCDGRGRC